MHLNSGSNNRSPILRSLPCPGLRTGPQLQIIVEPGRFVVQLSSYADERPMLTRRWWVLLMGDVYGYLGIWRIGRRGGLFVLRAHVAIYEGIFCGHPTMTSITVSAGKSGME